MTFLKRSVFKDFQIISNYRKFFYNYKLIMFAYLLQTSSFSIFLARNFNKSYKVFSFKKI